MTHLNLTPHQYFERVFQPAHDGEHTSGAMRNFAKAARSFERFAGPLPIGKLSQDDVDRFDDWLVGEVTQQTAMLYGGKLRRILNDACPERFSIRPAGRPRFDDDPADGSLMHFLLFGYVPRRIGLTAGAVEQYKISIRWLDRYLGRATRCDELTDDLLTMALVAMVGTCSRVTINKRRGELLTLWRHAHKRGLCPTTPLDVPRVKEPKRIPDCWSTFELGRLLAACGKAKGSIQGIPAGLYWTALVLVVYYTGLRIGAVRAARVADVDLAGGTLFVPAEHQKNFCDQRFTLHADALLALRLTLAPAPDRKLFFPWGQATKTFYDRFREIQRAAGLPVGAKHAFHKIRRTTGTFLCAALGINEASRFLGHSGLNVTKAYIDPSKLPAIDTAKALPRIGKDGAA